MRLGQIVSTCAAALAVGGCAAVVVVMGAASNPTDQTSPQVSDVAAPYSTIPATLPGTFTSSGSAGASAATGSASASPSTRIPAPASITSSAIASTAPVTRSYTAASSLAPAPPASLAAPSRSPAAAPAQTTVATPALIAGGRLPLGYSTATATRVITVVASSHYKTTATLQAWTKASGGGWLKVGAAVTAHIGSDGMTTAPSESKSATPEGSFTLTQAFGRYSNPATALPYFKTTPADWWISQSGSLYNTHQHCSSGCAFRLGSPNEHLYYETPYYDYAVVIDYNTRNAPGGVRQGAGSAFFLHVSVGTSTAGCVAIPQSNLVSIMRWLTPSAHPPILIGVT
jgi:L,D-peptidoglycan transpeptidase YkuD (ErfK/YbiS/YcfS/YnhG family)